MLALAALPHLTASVVVAVPAMVEIFPAGRSCERENRRLNLTDRMKRSMT